MEKIIQFLKDVIGRELVHVCGKFADALLAIAVYLNKSIDRKNSKDTAKKEKENVKNIENACDKGNLGDIYDAIRKASVIIVAITLTGCVHRINVDCVRTWEGHYFTEKEFKAGTSDVRLEKNESIWVLSNSTLKRIILNAKEMK